MFIELRALCNALGLTRHPEPFLQHLLYASPFVGGQGLSELDERCRGYACRLGV